MLTSNKDRWALSFLENTKTLIERTYPKDKALLNHVREALMIVCYKIQEKEQSSQ